MWQTFLRGRAETVFGPLGVVLSSIGALASVAFLLIAAFDSPGFAELQKISGTLTRTPQLMHAAKRPPWIAIFVEGKAEVLAIEATTSLKEDLVRDVLSLSSGTPITAWVQPDLRNNYLVIWQLHGSPQPLEFTDFVKANRAACFHYLKFTGLFLAIGLVFLWVEVMAWRRQLAA